VFRVGLDLAASNVHWWGRNMPTYEYVCTDCRNEWEEIQKISAEPLTDCPKCGKATAKRQISGGNFILKGGGWYADLYASPSPKKDAKPDGTAAAATDAKPATPAKTEGGGSSGGSGGGSAGGTGGGGSTSGGGSSGGSKASSSAAA
jgi:putative FmdB family regulatory protein